MDARFEVDGFTVGEELFRKGMKKGEGPCRCTAACCLGGVYADVAERDRIMAHRGLVMKYMDETQPHDTALWFEETEFADADFPSGRCVGTQEVNEKCAFLNKEGRCSLQVAATAEGLDKWFLKPMYCVLYPIEITNRTIRFDDLLQDEQRCCSVTDDFDLPLFQVCREELVHLLGADGFHRIEEEYRRVGQGEGGSQQ
jgi:hypothetical protein